MKEFKEYNSPPSKKITLLLNNVKECPTRDEFYTYYKDIENALSFLKDDLQNRFYNKIIYCNCDHYLYSNFVKYFKENFQALGIKKLIATNYSAIDLLNEGESFHYEYDGKNENVKKLIGDGDFRSDYCLNLMNEIDIIVTNPPFSLLSQLLKIITEKKKDFVLVMPLTFCDRKIYFNLKKNNKIFTITQVKKFYSLKTNDVSGVPCFFITNFSGKYQELKKEFEFVKYDDFDYYECSKLRDLSNFKKGDLVGVPITILIKNNITDVKIIEIFKPRLKGKCLFNRVLVRIL